MESEKQLENKNNATSIKEVAAGLMKCFGVNDDVAENGSETKELEFDADNYVLVECTTYPVKIRVIRKISKDVNPVIEFQVNCNGVVYNTTFNKMDTLFKKFSNSGIIFTHEDRVSILDNCKLILDEVFNHKPENMLHQHFIMGWKKIDNEWNYYGASGSLRDAKSVYSGTMPLKTRGTLENWISCVNKYIAPNKVSSIILCAAFVGILRQRFSEIREGTSILINLNGPTSIGKTTIEKAVLSVFGPGERLLMDFNSTQNALFKRAAERAVLLNTIDDLMQLNGSQKGKDIRELIFRISSGSDKARMSLSADQSEVKDNNRFWGATITSTTKSLNAMLVANYGTEDQGTSSRLLEISVQTDTLFNSAEEAECVSKEFRKNCGFADMAFAKYVVGQDEDDIIDDFYDYSDYKGLMQPRVARQVGILSLAAKILRDSMNIEIDPKEVRQNLIELFNRQYKTYYEVEQDNKKITPENVEAKIVEYYKNNKDGFIDCSKHSSQFESLEEAEKYIGFALKDENILELILPHKIEAKGLLIERQDILDQVLNEVGYKDILSNESDIVLKYTDKVVLRFLRERHKLIAGDGTFTKRLKVIKGAEQVRCTVLRLNMQE